MDLEKKELGTKITNVIVYQSGVQITKLGSINLSEGEHILSITDLPESLDKESVRVKGIGSGKILNITVEYNSKKEYTKEEHQKLQEEREKLDRGLKKVELEIARCQEQTQKFKTTEDGFYADWSSAYAYGEVGINNFLEFDEKVNELIRKNDENVDILEEKRKDLRDEIQTIANKMARLGPIEKVHNFYEITINLNVVKPGDFILEIRYTMTQAWWTPFYDISLSEGDANLTMMANVFNRTGVDWENVDLEISTASLKPIRLVRPNPMILQEYVPYHADLKKKRKAPAKQLGAGLMKKMEKERDIDGLMRLEETSTEESKPEIEQSYAEVSENIGVQSFKIPNKIDISSDKNPHPVNLTIQVLKTEKRYYWSCIAPENVIIQDRLTNGDLLLLAGNVKIYYLEEFLGETSIPLIAPKEEFKLGTRVSYDLKIDKKLIDRSKDKKAVKGKLKNNYEYKITIKNLNNASEELVVLDRIPHSSSESIKVVIESIMPEQDKLELGILKWKIPLKGMTEKVLNYKYNVEYQKDITITPSLP